jgi:hypothetical protein
VIESCNRIKVEVATPDKLKPREFWTGGGPSQPFKITGSVTDRCDHRQDRRQNGNAVEASWQPPTSSSPASHPAK